MSRKPHKEMEVTGQVGGSLEKKPKKRGGQPRNKNAAGRTPNKDGNRNAVTHGAFARVGIEDIPEDQAAAIRGMERGKPPCE